MSYEHEGVVKVGFFDIGNSLAPHQPTQQVFTAGNYVDYTYDAIGQLKTAVGREANDAVRLHEKFGYFYDGAWNLNRRTNNALVQTFDVNNLNQLTTLGRSGTLTVAGTTTSEATDVTVNELEAERYADRTFARAGFSLSDGLNTFTAIAEDAHGRRDTNVVSVPLPATVTVQYDLNGNLRTNGTRVFEYDDENQLVRITEPGAWRSEFVYDGKMRRRIRQEYAWSSAIGNWQLTNEVRYVYDGNLVIQERHFNAQLSTLNPQQTITYTRGRDLSGGLKGAGGIGGLLARSDNSLLAIGDSRASAYYHADGNGNVTCLVAVNELVVARYHYDPYGNTLSASGLLAGANLYRFSSKEWHPSSGLVYYLYRFYDGSLQRWVNRDPIEEKGGLNLYAMLDNRPVSRFDPEGLLSRLCRDPEAQRECVENARRDRDYTICIANKALDDCLDYVRQQNAECHSWCDDRPPSLRPLCKMGCDTRWGTTATGCYIGANLLIAGAWAAFEIAEAACMSGATISVPVDSSCPEGFDDIGIGY